MTLKGDAVFKEKLTHGLKNDIRNLINFHASSRKSESWHYDGLLFSKAYKVLDDTVSLQCLMTLKNYPKKSSFLRNINFLCDVIDLKQSVEGTLKVQGKSLTTVLDEIHFIVNLYSFPIPLVFQANPSFHNVRHFLPPTQNKFQNSPLSFCSPLFSEDIPTSSFESTKW